MDLKRDIGGFYFRILRRVFFPNSPVEHYQASEAIEVINKFIIQSLNKNIIASSDTVFVINGTDSTT